MRPALCLLLVSLVSIAGAAPLVPNVLPDPGFEGKEWTLSSWEVCEFKSEYVPEAHSGQLAAKLTAIKPGKDKRISAIAISKAVAVQGGQSYLLGLWYRTDPDVTAAVSVTSFSEPFATAGWKTPKSSYNTYLLPASTSWRLWTLRFTMPPNAVEVSVLPRMQMAGTAWFDDVSLAPAGQAEIKLKQAGQISKLPDTRLYGGSVQAPQGCECRLDIYAHDGSLLKSLPGQGDFTLSAAVPAGQPAQAVLVEPRTGSLLAAREFAAPPLVTFLLNYPRYRKTIFTGDQRTAATATLEFCAAPDILKKMSFQSVLKRPDGSETKSETTPVVKPAEGNRALIIPEALDVRQRLPEPLAAGTYTFGVTVTAPDGPHEFAADFRVAEAPPAGTHEFTVNAANALLMDGKPFFARGFMGGAADVYGPAAEAGFNVGHSFGGSAENQLKWLDGLQGLGMFGITGMPGYFVEKKDLEGLREAVRKMRSHPALLGYYFPDEPAPTKEGMTPKDWQPFYDLMVQEDPYHPVMTTMYNAEFANDYAGCLDILLFDPYPITHNRRPLTMVSDFILRARELTHDRQPVWFVPQAFGYDVVQGLDKPPTWTTPTPEQERCMTYLGLATGAQGLVYYCYHVYTKYDKAKKDAGGWPWVLGGYLPDQQPALWGALAKIGQELKTLAPALGRPSRMWQEGGIFLREISPVGPEPGYLIGVNPSEEKPAEVAIKLQSRLPRLHELEELGQRTSRVAITGSEVRLKLAPMQVGLWMLPGRP
ncbi:MAG: hypothetical protein KKI08_15810 [Armatimonadetes bacterium]|nr:hypothetical protein [Armatimonadota bacterium]